MIYVYLILILFRFLNASFLFFYDALYRIKGPFVPILRKIVKRLLSSRYILVFCIMLFDVDLYRLPRADNGEMDGERERYKKTKESKLICVK